MMVAKRIDGQAVNGRRGRLADAIPLDTPYAITIFPIYACNFKCNYCIHSLPSKDKKFSTDIISMDFGLYKKCIDDITEFPRKIKVLHFIGYGEPLLHRNIIDMVKYAADKKIAENIDIVTNGYLLTKKMADKIANSGLTTLRISMQGLSGEDYLKKSNIDLDFNQFYQNIKYFYQCKGKTKLHIKIIDIGLSENEKKDFIKKFSPISDTIAIENLVQVISEIDYENLGSSPSQYNTTVAGDELLNFEICSQPFYSLQINPDGKCVPCCSAEIPICVGNVKQISVKEIWNGSSFNKFRRMQICKEKRLNAVCRDCTQYKYSVFKEDVLDYDTEKLEKFFK